MSWWLDRVGWLEGTGKRQIPLDRELVPWVCVLGRFETGAISLVSH